MSGASDPFLLYLRCSLFGLQSLGPTDGGMMPLPTSTYLWPFANASRSASKVGTCWVFGFWVHWVRKHSWVLCGYIYIYGEGHKYTRTLYIYKFTHTYIYDIFIYNTFTKYTCTYRYTIKHIDRYNRFIQMHREIKSNVHLAMALSNENKPGSCEHGQGVCPATWQSFQGHCALATIFRGCWGRITTGISMDIPWRTGWCLEGLGLNQGWDWASNFLV